MNKNITAKKYQSGFTLVEILVSLVIVLILVIAFVPMFELVAKTVSSNKAKDTATSLANQQIEYLRTLPYIVVDDNGNIDESQQQLGTINGNPPGSVPEVINKPIQNKEYIVRTNISWTDATLTSKDVSVQVEYIGAFGDKLVVSKFFTKAAEEKQLVANKRGSILVKVLDKDGLPLTKTDVYVKIDPQTGDGSPQQGYTQEGEKLFAMLPSGTYVVSAEIPEGMTYSPDQSIVNGWLEMDATVADNATETCTFYVDYPGRITLAFKANNKNIIGNGNLELSWTNDENPPAPLLQKQFDADVFNDNRLPASFLGNLWPGGNYSLKVSDLLDTESMHIYNYDMTVDSKPVLNGDDWNGTFETSDTTLDLTIIFTTVDSLMDAYLIINPDKWEDTLDFYEDEDNGNIYISSWEDQSGKDNDAKPDVTAEKTYPTLSEGPPLSVHFDGGTSHQRVTFKNLPPNNNFTVFFVAKTNQSIEIVDNGETISKEQLNFLMYSGAGNELGISLGKNGVSTCEYSNGNKYKQTVNYGANIGDGFNVIAVNCKNRTPNIYVNNTRTVGVLSSADPLYLASIIGGGPHGNDAYFSGNIAEVIIYNSSLSDSNMDYLITHLMDKFDIK